MAMILRDGWKRFMRQDVEVYVNRFISESKEAEADRTAKAMERNRGTSGAE